MGLHFNSEEFLSPGFIYLFLTLGEDPRTSKAFVAILGAHALALSQEDGHPFEAVRMVRSSTTLSPHDGWDLVYSTPPISLPLRQHSLQTELSSFLARLSSQGNTLGSCSRGDKIHLCLDEPRTWTVYDCGVIEQS
jgi:hypothetical protein